MKKRNDDEKEKKSIAVHENSMLKINWIDGMWIKSI